MQADAYVDQNNPGSGTKYEWSSDGTQTNKLGALANIRIIGISVYVTWTVQPDVEVHVTIDGQVLTFDFAAPVSNTPYYAFIQASKTAGTQDLNANNLDHRPFLLEGRSVKIECETTGGTTSKIFMLVKYAKW